MSQAEIEEWLALEPGERLEVTGEDLGPHLTPESSQASPMLFAGVLTLFFGGLAALRALVQGEALGAALMGACLVVPGLAMLYAGLRMRSQERRRAPVWGISAGGDGLVLRSETGSTPLSWSRLDDLMHASLAYDTWIENQVYASSAVPQVRPETWRLTFRQTPGQPLPDLYVAGKDAAGKLFIAGVQRILAARREGMRLPGAPGRTGVDLPEDALPPSVELSRPERGLSRADDEATS